MFFIYIAPPFSKSVKNRNESPKCIGTRITFERLNQVGIKKKDLYNFFLNN